jgi:predicted phosphodiesterase
MKIHLISDIHLEFNRNVHINNSLNFDVIALCGDIGQVSKKEYFDFIAQVTKSYKLVILILGNHEFYDNEIFHVKDKVRNFCKKFSNLYLLDNNILETESAIFLGTTLWFDFDIYDYFRVFNKLNDYQSIKINQNKKIRKLSPNDTKNFFNESITWLEKTLEYYKDSNKKIIILTHHAPLTQNTSDKIYDLKEKGYLGFSTDLSYLFEKYNIDYWCFGHTHKYTDILYENINI